MSSKPKLCPDCPREPLLHDVHNKSWNNAPAIDTIVKLCSKLRAADTNLPQCPHYPENEKIDKYFRVKRRKH